jgi:hypothetical protein
MLHMPAPMLLGASKDPYEAFVAHITAKATGGPVSWISGLSVQGKGAGKYIVTASEVFSGGSGTMFGSPWGSYFSPSSPPGRLCNHGFPTSAWPGDQLTAARKIYFEIALGSVVSSFTGLDRNGFPSASLSEPDIQSYWMTDLIYWDGTAAQRVNPQSEAGPILYTVT